MSYSKMPADAPIQLKKKLRNYNLKDDYIFLLDQVAPQNLSNSPTTICKTSEKNIQTQNPDKFKGTGIGIQGVNAKSFFLATTNSRLKEMIRFITKSREINCKNSYVVNRLIRYSKI